MRVYRTIFLAIATALFGFNAHASPELIQLCQKALKKKAAQELPGATFDFKRMHGAARDKKLIFTMRYISDWGFALCVVKRDEISELNWPEKFNKKIGFHEVSDSDGA